MKDLIKKQDEEFYQIIKEVAINGTYAKMKTAQDFISKVRKETAEYEKDRIKEKVEDWRRGFSMTCAESDVYEKAHQQILKVLKDI